LILVTHPHGDHFDRKAIAGLSTAGTVTVLPGLLKAELAIPMHYGMLLGGRGAGGRFSALVGAGSLVLPRAGRHGRK